MSDLFAGPTDEELQNRHLERARVCVDEAIERVKQVLKIPPGKIDLEKVAKLNKDLGDIHIQIEDLKKMLAKH